MRRAERCGHGLTRSRVRREGTWTAGARSPQPLRERRPLSATTAHTATIALPTLCETCVRVDLHWQLNALNAIKGTYERYSLHSRRAT